MTPKATITRYTATVQKLERFFSTYLSLPESYYTLVLSLWTICTFIYPDFDAFPYMVITSDTKRSGKTRLAELLSFVCSNPVSSGALTPAAIFRTLGEERPTLFFDEAETLDGEAANTMRSVLNMGYRRGSVVRRVIGNQVREFPVYSPKVFILIGDVYDTLNDRSIVVRMRRGEAPTRFVYETAKAEGASIREELAALVEESRFEMVEFFTQFKRIEFLTDRDEEIWTPLFVALHSFCPERQGELNRAAVDMSTEKTQSRRRYVDLLAESEKKAESAEYEEKLLLDLAKILSNEKYITTSEALEKLRGIEIAPWRKFRGEGVSSFDLSNMLSRFGLRPKNIRVGKQVIKGYSGDDIRKAAKQLQK